MYVMPMGEVAKTLAMQTAAALRISGYRVDMCFEEAKLGNMFKRAERKGAQFAIIIGENEVNNQEVIIKNLATTEQKSVPVNKLIETINKEMGEECCGEQCHCRKES